MLICDLIQGRPNRWASLYDPSRIRAGAAAAFIKENLKRRCPVRLLAHARRSGFGR
jgi:hypothetical protein